VHRHVLQLFGCTLLPLGDLGVPDLPLLGDVGEVGALLGLNVPELLGQTLDGGNLALVNGILDFVHDPAHHFFALTFEGLEVVFFNLGSDLPQLLK